MSNSKETLRIYSLHSQKGGVGKTSLAIAIAGLECVYRESKTLLIDADLTGTCLWDALGRELKEQAKYSWFNDILDADPDEFLKFMSIHGKSNDIKNSIRQRWEKFLFGHNVGDTKITFDAVQSNPQFEVVREIIPSLAQESFFHFYGERLIDIIMTVYDLDYRTLLIDLPPGLFGFSEAIFSALNNDLFCDALKQRGFVVNGNSRKDRANAENDIRKSEKELIINPIAVTTMDKMDYLSTFPAAWTLMETCNDKENYNNNSKFQIWFNKGMPVEEDETVPFDPPKDFEEIFKLLFRIDEYKNRFGGEKLGNYKAWLKEQKVGVEKSGGPAFPYVPYFSISNICDVISNLFLNKKPKGENVKENMTSWVRNVAFAIDINPDVKKGQPDRNATNI